jgi:hypothetical protein
VAHLAVIHSCLTARAGTDNDDGPPGRRCAGSTLFGTNFRGANPDTTLIPIWSVLMPAFESRSASIIISG